MHRKNRLKWAQDNKATNWKQVIFSDETTIRLNAVKGIGMNFASKKEDRTKCQAFDQGERRGLFFKSKFWSRRLFQAEFQCCIHM